MNINTPEQENSIAAATDIRNSRNGGSSSSPWLLRAAVRMSRAKWFSFLRRVFHYQNDSRSDLASNPFNSPTWMTLELFVLLLQIIIICISIFSSKPTMTITVFWLLGYEFGCLLSLPVLYWRYYRCSSEFMNKWRTCLELFFATWFVMGIVMFRIESPKHQQQQQLVCIYVLLVWNTVSYSFPFLLFIMFCCCVPVISNRIGYNMNVVPFHRGATEDGLSNLRSWKYKQEGEVVGGDEDEEADDQSKKKEDYCSICLTRYRDKEEVRQLPCSHVFHLKCVDRWLVMIASCPLCKQELETW